MADPKYHGAVTEVPEGAQGGDWKPKLTKWRSELVNEAGERLWHRYDNIGSSTSSNLKRDYGVDARSVTIDGVLCMFVQFPAKQNEAGEWVVDEQAVYENRITFKQNKGKLTPPGADNGSGSGGGDAPAETPAAAGGRRSR